MDEIQEIDTVLQHVRQVAGRLSLSANGTITQQILLLGEDFYGYRYTATDFIAVWSAAEQILKMFDAKGRPLGNFPIVEAALDSQRKAA